MAETIELTGTTAVGLTMMEKVWSEGCTRDEIANIMISVGGFVLCTDFSDAANVERTLELAKFFKMAFLKPAADLPKDLVDGVSEMPESRLPKL